LADKLEKVIAEFDLPAYVVGVGAKGCIVWADPAGGKLRDHRDYQRRFDMELGYLAWVYLMNRGVFMCPGHDEQFTHSVFHGPAEADLFANTIRALARELRSQIVVQG
jgi:glutamate-1-semialdehyde 2,1-aminomutase